MLSYFFKDRYVTPGLKIGFRSFPGQKRTSASQSKFYPRDHPNVNMGKGPSINYLVSVEGGEINPKDNLLHRLYLIKKTTRGRGSKIANFETT